jgi:hypothetical protein
MFPDSMSLPSFPRTSFAPFAGPAREPRLPEFTPTYHPVFHPRPQENPKRVQPWVPTRPAQPEPATEPEFEPEDARD